ncbi:unnamed protein product [Candida verbasci]|uniref:Uncharacterized protein n=1 Tax=Candida verbasci TaxID=1227364 RepID=A0A9W4XC48_9ASCO|nr:unnamed protein product [Candida verbasci]
MTKRTIPNYIKPFLKIYHHITKKEKNILNAKSNLDYKLYQQRKFILKENAKLMRGQHSELPFTQPVDFGMFEHWKTKDLFNIKKDVILPTVPDIQTPHNIHQNILIQIINSCFSPLKSIPSITSFQKPYLYYLQMIRHSKIMIIFKRQERSFTPSMFVDIGSRVLKPDVLKLALKTTIFQDMSNFEILEKISHNDGKIWEEINSTRDDLVDNIKEKVDVVNRENQSVPDMNPKETNTFFKKLRNDKVEIEDVPHDLEFNTFYTLDIKRLDEELISKLDSLDIVGVRLSIHEPFIRRKLTSLINSLNKGNSFDEMIKLAKEKDKKDTGFDLFIRKLAAKNLIHVKFNKLKNAIYLLK